METIAEDEGLTFKIEQDEDAFNPRKEYDNFGVMVCWHRRYDLSDNNDFSSPDDFLEWWKENGKGGELIPLGLLDHSGLHMYCGGGSHWTDGAGWDSGTVGFIYATADMIRKEYGKRITKAVREKTRKLLTGEVETYDQYLTGDVWGYMIEDAEGEHIESCWGFYGFDYCKEEGLSIFKYYTEKARAERLASESADECLEDCTV